MLINKKFWTLYPSLSQLKTHSSNWSNFKLFFMQFLTPFWSILAKLSSISSARSTSWLLRILLSRSRFTWCLAIPITPSIPLKAGESKPRRRSGSEKGTYTSGWWRRSSRAFPSWTARLWRCAGWGCRTSRSQAREDIVLACAPGTDWTSSCWLTGQSFRNALLHSPLRQPQCKPWQVRRAASGPPPRWSSAATRHAWAGCSSWLQIHRAAPPCSRPPWPAGLLASGPLSAWRFLRSEPWARIWPSVSASFSP